MPQLIICSCPDNNHLLTSGSKDSCEHTVKVWDIERGALLGSLVGHTAGVDKLLLTGDGRLVSSCSNSSRDYSTDSTVKVWDIERSILSHSHVGHTAGITNLFLINDRHLFSFCRSRLYSTINDHTPENVGHWISAQPGRTH